MNIKQFVPHALALALIAALAGCAERSDTTSSSGVIQTKFPGEVTAGGGTSGQVLSRNAQASGGNAASGTPGIAGGAGGNTGGAATGGTTPPSGHAANVGGTPGIPAGSGGNTGGTAPGAGKAPPADNQGSAK